MSSLVQMRIVRTQIINCTFVQVFYCLPEETWNLWPLHFVYAFRFIRIVMDNFGDNSGRIGWVFEKSVL